MLEELNSCLFFKWNKFHLFIINWKVLSRRLQNQSLCLQNDLCTWDYNGIGLEYQVRYIEKSSSETSLNVVVVLVKF